MCAGCHPSECTHCTDPPARLLAPPALAPEEEEVVTTLETMNHFLVARIT